ncbi:MAG: Gfo/Idh/MocA family oxidoreductase [Candidatus Ancaeobacter aquaticus]|nr:Gfo/Idh/MocA family oxidoreductase [Candidatus Ancaeobacter aquaticus]
MEKLKAVVIGVGHLGRHHARVYTELQDVELVGVVDSDSGRGNKVAKKHNVQYYSSIEPILDTVDVANVVVPTPAHFEIAEKLLCSGVHVLIEKPITETLEQAEKLVKLQKEKDVVLQVGHIERFNPAIRAVKDIVFNPMFVEVHRLCPYNPRGTDVGVVLDLMIHDIDILLNLVPSPVKEIRAVGINVVSENDDIANARIEFENGCVANIAASKIGNKEMRKIRIFQNKAYISLDYQNQNGYIYTMNNAKVRRKKIPLKKDEPLKSEIQSFIESVKKNEVPLVTGEHGLHALEVAMEIIAQIREKKKLMKERGIV